MNETASQIPIIGFAARSGTGKTTLLKQIIPMLDAHGVQVAMIKHAHHSFEIDQPGKDSYELRKAGAGQMLVASDRRWALVTEHKEPSEPRLADLLARIDHTMADLVLVEGFKAEALPKIELHRRALGRPLFAGDDPHVVAIATDTPEDVGAALPVLPLNEPDAVANFVIERFLGRSHPGR